MLLLSPPLQAFLAVTRAQTVHGAARELGLTQTGVTQRIRALETSLSTTLFTRSRKGMALTSEGHALLHYCRATLDLEGEALARIEGAGRTHPVRATITGPSSIMRSRIIPQCLPVLARMPEMAVTFEVNDLDTREEALRSGGAQLAILAPERVAREMDSKVLKAEKYVLVGPPSWKRRPIQEIVQKERIVDFDLSDPLSFDYLRRYALLKYARPERHFVNRTESLVELIAAGLGYGVLTTEFAEPYLRERKLALLNSGREHENRVALAWYPRPRMPAYFAALIRSIR
jgi:DNA-binding transcriptional LysR family regulator